MISSSTLLTPLDYIYATTMIFLQKFSGADEMSSRISQNKGMDYGSGSVVTFARSRLMEKEA